MKDWKLKRKNKALRNSLIRLRNSKDAVSINLLEKRIKQANVYLKKLKNKQTRGWFK